MAKGITVPVVQSGLEASIEAAAKKAGPLTLSATVDPSSFKRLAQPLGRVSGLATEFEKSIAASNARVIAFGASVGIINGVQNAFASLVKTTIEVEKSLTNIAVISGKTTDELQPFSRALFEIAKTTSQSFQTASEAALEFSRQGLSLEETLKRTQDALTLTRFTSLSAAEAVDVLTAAANSFGETGITTSEILNKLVAVDTKFAVSAEDLAKGLSRAGSIAQEVGVNFDELNAIVTIAQERTARGGAVIGNAFKTIFTRIRSDETIQALQSIGIYSFDAEGRLKPVVGLLEELAGKINTLSETKRIEVLESIASKYNINVLTALVDDLGSTTSKFREARDVSAGAQNEAYQRQIELNKTLDAVITRVVNSAAQLADTLGRIGVTDSLKSLLNFFDNILTGINDVIDSEGIGGTIAKGLISGLSGVFFKIGIPLLLAIFVKLTKDIAQFGTESLKTILGINKEVRERQALEQAVVNTLIKDQQVMATILSLSGDRRKQEEYLLSVYNRQLAALQQVQSIAANVAPALQAAGLSATSGTIKKRAAGGYLPAEEAKDVRRGVGGASPSSKVVEIPNFSFGGGKRGTMVANTSEYIVPNYAGGSGTAIFNQDMAKEYGLPPGAKKITASGGFVPASGFVPNFAEQNLKIERYKTEDFSVKELKQKVGNFKNSEKADNIDVFSADLEIIRQPKTNKEFDKEARSKTRAILKNFGATTGKNIDENYFGKVDPKTGNFKPGELIKYYEGKADPSSVKKLVSTVRNLTVSKDPKQNKESFKAVQNTIKGIEGEISAAEFLNTKITSGNKGYDLETGEEVKTRGETPQSNLLKKLATGYLETHNIKQDPPKKDQISNKNYGVTPKVVLPLDGKISRASTGYVPNFAKEIGPRKIVDSRGMAGMIVPDKNNERVMEAYLNSSLGFETKPKVQDKTGIYYVKYHTYGLNEAAFEGEALKKGGDITNIEADVQKFGLEIAKKYSYKYASEYSKSLGGSAAGVQISDEDVKKSFLASKGAVSGFSSLGGGIFETAIRTGVQGEVNKDLVKAQQTELGAGKLDFKVTDVIRRLFGVNRGETEVDSKIEGNPKSTGRSLADQIVENNLYKYERTLGVAGMEKGRAIEGYIPSFAEKLKKTQEVLAPSGQFYDLDTADAFLAASNVNLEAKPSAPKGLGDELKKRILTSARRVYGPNAQIGISRLSGKREAFTSTVLANPALADDFIALQKATTGGVGPESNTPEALAKFNNPTPFDPTPWPAVRAVGGKTRSIKKVGPRSLNAAAGYIPNFADLFVDYDYTIFGQQLGKAADFNAQKALIKNIPEDQMTEQERKARDAQMKLLTPFGQNLLQSKKPFKLATARWNDYQPGIESSLRGLGFNVNGVFALGREFSEEQYKVDNPKFAEEMKKPEGERNTRVKPRIEPSAAQKKALFFKERAPQMATGDIDFVDNDPANLQAVKSLMPKINTFTPDQYMAKLLAPQEVKEKKASLGYIPNFADNEPLKEALNREVAAGVPPARVRVTQDQRLKNSKNPNGLAVINTRDEPNGKIPSDFRERGMRAAMASRGFVPNFAEENVGVNVRGIFSGKTKKFDDKIDQLANATNEALLEYKQNKISLEQLNEKINASKAQLAELAKAQKLSADVERKYAERVDQGIKKINERNKNSATGATNSAQPPILPTSKKDVDLGKFLVLQSAIVGLTSAFQSATEQGSAAANALEGVSAVASGIATFAAIGTTLSPQLRLLAAGVTALASAFPLLSRLYEDFKDPAEKTAEALAKLGKEAERTGKKISPEEFLAVFQQQEAKTKEEQTRKNVTAQIQSALGAEGVSLNETDLYSIYAGLSASGSIGADQKVDPKVIKDLLAPAINKEPSVAQRAKRLSAQDVVNIGIGGLQFGGLFGEAVSAARGRVGPIAQSVSKVGANTLDTKTANQAIQERVLQKQLETARKPQTEQRTEKAVNTENELLKIKFGILDGLLKKELEINKVYADRIRGIASLNTNLERSQTIATEQRYSEIQASLERKKVQAEESKGISENINNLKSSLSGLQDKGLGNIFGEIDTDKVRGLMQAFQSGGVGSDAFKKAFEESTSRVENGQAVAGVNLDQFDPKTREQVFKTLYDAVSNESKLRANSANRIADIDQAQKDFLPSAKRLTNETDQLNAIIAGTPFFVQKLNETFSGAEKYQELLNTEQAKLANSFAKQILQNKITLDSAKQSFEIETKLLQAKLDLEQGIRDRIPIEQRAAKDAIELNRSTLERIDQLKKDAINAPKRLQSQKDILSAETGVIESENAVGGGEVDLEKVLILRRNSIAKLAQSERAAEEETRSNIGMIRKKVDADRASVDRQTRTIEAEEDLYKNGIDLTNVISIRRSMVAKLVQSERKAEEETLASIGMMRQKMDAERAAIDRQTRLTEEENRIYNSNDKDLNIAALRRSTLAKLEQSERKAEEENQAAIKTVNEKYKADLDGIERQAELTEAQNAAVDASKQSTAVAVGLRLARAKLVESERKAEEENQIAIRMIGQSYEADINSTKRKIEYAQALIGQIDAAKTNEKVTGEMTLETMNLITSLREAQAKFNNIDIEVGNEALKARTNILGETTSTISRGLALSNLGIGGELETQAFAQVAEQRRAGRKAEDIGTSELYDISKGRNLSVRQGLSIQKAALLDEAQTFQDIIGKSTPKLFADGMAEAMQAAMNQADDLGGALRNVALNFLKSLQSAFLQNASRQIVASILPNAAPAGMRQGGYVKGYASGGLVTGGSGYKDDVPAMLSAGEYVIRKSSVEKYGAHNLNKLNSGEPPKFASGGIFLPGIRGQGQISGYKDLTAFANQTTTSGATDVLAGGASTAFASLEDQSSRLSAYALMNEDDTINQEIRSAQEQARNIMAEREAYRTAERKAFQKQLVGTVASAALSFGIGKATGALFGPKPGVGVPNLGFNSADVASKITQPAIPTPNMLSAPIRTASTSFGDFMSPARAQVPSYGSLLSMFQPQIQSPGLQGSTPFSMPRIPGRAYGGMIPRFADGGSPTDKVPALVMGGEYIMSEKATKKYGKQFFDSINQGRAPRFADGGQVSTSEPSFAEKAAASSDSKASSATNVSININVTGGTSESQSQGDTKQGGIDYKKMSEQIKQIVITTINEEKRLGGSLRPRG
jgi:TP901 family phage tail tape measure protein